MLSIPVIITLAVLLLLAVLTPQFSPFRRSVDEDEDIITDDALLPSVSIVLVDHDCSYHLKRILPRYLSQQYPQDFQIVVVIDQGDTESEDYLKVLCEQDGGKHLYYTVLPESSRYLSRKKLGITLGMRAAKYDWVLLADVDCRPSSNDWLRSVARHATEKRNLVLGVTPYEEDAPAYYRFEQLRTSLYHLHKAQEGQPFSTNYSMLMLRKTEFFEERGFYGNLEYARAEYEFLVNKFGKEGKCGLAIEPEARMEQHEPQSDYWVMKRLYALDALKSLNRSAKFKSLFKIDLWLMHIYNILTLLIILCALPICMVYNIKVGEVQIELPQVVENFIRQQFMLWDGVALLGGAVALWIISLIIRCNIYGKVLDYYETGISSLSAVIKEWTITLRNMTLRIHYFFADKTDFITHKL